MIKQSTGYAVLKQWLQLKGWTLIDFQKTMLAAFQRKQQGILNAATGSGKTYGLWFPILVDVLNEHAKKKPNPNYKGLQIIWITPQRALAKDLRRNMQDAADGLGVNWQVNIRTGDISKEARAKQNKKMPEALITTPESLHLLFSQKAHNDVFKNVRCVVVDEWHELLGTKRGVQTELALAQLKHINPQLHVWGISATIGNMQEALEVLLGKAQAEHAIIVQSKYKKRITVKSVLPDHVESLPWAGHLGINLLEKVLAIVNKSKTTLLFTNTRSQTEIWYRTILEKHPELAGLVALHHGSLDRDIRDWVEQALHNEKLKLVICTSSLDLGVDFRPVETVIQVGSPKSIARFIQRAGRSGHQPNDTSIIYFTPTHALELIEGVALREGVRLNMLENRMPIVNAFDVLAQWMVTLAVGGGFDADELYKIIKTAYAFQFINEQEWQWLLNYLVNGSQALYAYDEFKKVVVENNRYVVNDRKIAMRHRLSMGTIVSEMMVKVKLMNGKYIGSVEESFASRLKDGDVFWFGGITVSFVNMRNMEVLVRKVSAQKGIVPQWMGGRMPLSSSLSVFIRENLANAISNPNKEVELKTLQPLFELQQQRSHIPQQNELLIEQCKTREGHHIFVYPFEGRLVHEGMAALLAYRLSKLQPITFSIAMNDYGFELLSDQYIDLNTILAQQDLFTTDDLISDIYKSINATEMIKRKFREIAVIAGMVFQGYPGRSMKARHLQASSSLLFDVVNEYESNNLFIKQAQQEVLDFQLEETRMRYALERIAAQAIVVKHIDKPTPLAFPILVDRLREQLTSEKLEERIAKMIKQHNKDAK